MAGQKIQIIGIGDDGADGLTAASRKTIADADVLVGAGRILEAMPVNSTANRISIGGDLGELVRELEPLKEKNVVILATGDPMFYGVARFLCERMGKDTFEVTPHVSSMQLAFARVKESWDEAYLANLATVDLQKVVNKARSSEKVGLFTTESISPSDVAAALLEQEIDYFTAYVCENLGSPDERVTQSELAEVVNESFSPLNVMVLVRKPEVPDRPASMAGTRLFGNEDETFAQSQPKRGLLTPMEVRVVALALLDIGPRSIIWDVGAGSGSVSIEAARLASEGTAYAIEMAPEDHGLIRENASRCAVTNVTAVLGIAPEAWADLPDPDAIFVGGTGRAVRNIADLACERLKTGGRIVVNVGSIDDLSAVHSALTARLGEATIRMINVAHAMEQLEVVRFESQNPTFLISAVK